MKKKSPLKRTKELTPECSSALSPPSSSEWAGAASRMVRAQRNRVDPTLWNDNELLH